MDELKEIREALKLACSIMMADGHRIDAIGPDTVLHAIAALNRLESRESKKTVPMAMIDEICKAWDEARVKQFSAYETAARYGYEVTE